MYQSYNPTQPIQFDPEAKIVIADRAMDTYAHEFGKPIELSAEEISNRLRSGYLNGLNSDRASNKIESIVSAVKNAASETDDEEFVEFLGELADILNITLTKSYRVSLQYTIDATIELPLGTDSDEVTYDDFEISFESSNYDIELTDWEVSDSRLDYIEPNE